MFAHWDSYYILIGSASGALIGLLFVVATLQSGRDPEASARGASIYLTPTVFHFAVVLVISAVASAPGLPPWSVGLILGGGALWGLAYAVSAAVRIRVNSTAAEPPHWSDFWYYGVAPGLGYLGLAASAVGALTQAASTAYLVAAALLALLLIGIRNAWDLVTWLAQRAPRP